MNKKIKNLYFKNDETETNDFFLKTNKINYFYEDYPLIIHILKARKFNLFFEILEHRISELDLNKTDKYGNSLLIYIIRMDKGLNESDKIFYIKKLAFENINVFKRDIFGYNALMESARFDQYPSVFNFFLNYYFKFNSKEFKNSKQKIEEICKNNNNKTVYKRFINKINFIDFCDI